MNTPTAPPRDEIKQPEWPKLRDVLGPGLITGASDDDPERHRHLFPGRRAVRLHPRLDAAADLSADVRDPADQRANRPGHRSGSRRQHRAAHYPAWLLYPAGRPALSSPTRSISAPILARWRAALHLLVDGPMLVYIVGFAIVTVLAEVFLPLRPLRLGPAMADPVAVRLCRRRSSWSACPGRRWPQNLVLPHISLDRRLSHRHRRGLRHHHQPLSLLLAGRRGGRGRKGGSGGQAADQTRRSRRRSRWRACSSTPASAWASPTSSRSSSC